MTKREWEAPRRAHVMAKRMLNRPKHVTFSHE